MLAVSVSQLLQPHTGYLIQKQTGKVSKKELRNPAEVLNMLDREYPFERFNNFFTISYVILDTSKNTLQYSNAGHPPPILQRSDGSLELLTRGGHSIGMGSFKTAKKGENFFSEESIELQSGDKLFVYSDGITECQNRSGGFFGNDRLFRELKELNDLPVSEMVDALIKTIKTFGGDLKPQDDVTLFGLQLN
jgi:sigma-B regulation protein RsbU (phosphoserine phosphatase)